MAKQARVYNVYEEVHSDIGLRDHDEVQITRSLIGEQWAVSEAQAVSRYCYKTGRYAETFHEWAGDTGRIVRIVAEVKA